MASRSKSLSLLTVLLLALNNSSASLADEKSADEGPTLTIGSPAPELDIEHWVSNGKGKFKPVTKFEKGKVYVVEFWATWCGPCVQSMPHLAEVQKKYADKGVQIVSVSDEDLETVQEFLKNPLQGDESEEANEKEKKETFGTLTSVYCLTTDPDQSVAKDYMEASGQAGIPTCFIVGKSSQIEWIGHPMDMDSPLEQVVTDSWDRTAHLAEIKKQQELDAFEQKVGKLMDQGKSDAALALIAEARKTHEKEEKATQFLNQLELRIQLTPAIEKLRQGEVDEAIKMLDETAKKLPEASQTQVAGLRFRILLSVDRTDDAATMLKTLTAAKKPVPDLLGELAWQVFQAAEGTEDFSKPLLSAATAAAEKAIAGSPENSMILDTLAHLYHLTGELDKAIATQELAVKYKNAPAEKFNAQMAEYLKELKAEKGEK